MVGTTSSQRQSIDSEERARENTTRVAPAAPKQRVWPRRLALFLFLIVMGASVLWGGSWFLRTRNPSVAKNMRTSAVRRGDLVVTVAKDGNLESAVNIDLKCEVAGGSNILWIVDDGDQVRKGDKLVELDSSALEEQINQQRITCEKARAAKIQAEKDFAAAGIAVNEYLEGTFVKSVQEVDNQITIAEENLRSAQTTLEHSKRMFRKGYISALDLESQTFSVQRAELELRSAQTAKDVLINFTKKKTLQELESARDSAEAQAKSEAASFDLEDSRLQRLESQLRQCVITAPADGMVVYANEMDHHGRSEQPQIEEGAAVRERQTIVRLPDLNQMQVKVNVHESRVEALGEALKKANREGHVLPANVTIQGRQLNGRVTNIANQPAPAEFWSGNVKEYPTIIAIDENSEGLRPGMTAECEILVEKLQDVLLIPMSAVIEWQGEYLCWVATPSGTERRPLLLGTSNDRMVEVKDGVKEGERVVLNPRATIPDARAIFQPLMTSKTDK